MSSDIVGSIVLLAVFLILSAIFSATETAITAAGRMKLRAMENAFPEKKDLFAWLADNIQRVLSATLVGNNIVNIAASTVATILFTKIDASWGPVAAVAVMSTIVVIFCEILPKSIAIIGKESVIASFLPLIRFFAFIMAPIITVVQTIVRAIGRLFGHRLDTQNSFVTREDFEIMVSASEESGAIEEEERKMISGVISFEETRVSEIMLARTDMTTIESETDVRTASNVFLESGHSRIPVYEGELDKICGILYVKDLLAPMMDGRLDDPIEPLIREPLFLPETIKTDEAFELMKRSKVHMAIIVDEYGGTAGLVTLEDLIEEIVGDIQDEYDDEKPDVLEERDGVYIVQGNVNLEDLSEELGYPFEFEDVDTVAGMLLSIKGNFPTQGEVLHYEEWRLTAMEVEEHRVLQVKLERVGSEEEI